MLSRFRHISAEFVTDPKDMLFLTEILMRSVGDGLSGLCLAVKPQLNFGTANTTTETIRVAPGTNYPQQEVEGNWRLYFIVRGHP